MTNLSFAPIQTTQCLLSTVSFAFLHAQMQKRPKTCIICSEIAPQRRVCLMMMLNSRSWFEVLTFFPCSETSQKCYLFSVTNILHVFELQITYTIMCLLSNSLVSNVLGQPQDWLALDAGFRRDFQLLVTFFFSLSSAVSYLHTRLIVSSTHKAILFRSWRRSYVM